MPVLHFVDASPSSLGKLEHTPQGGYRAPAKMTRAGVMPYLADTMRAQGIEVPAHIPRGGIVNIYTPPETLAAAVDSLRGGECPVTDGHPPRMVHPDNYAEHVRGNVLGHTVSFDGEFLHGMVALQDQKLIGKVESREATQVSMGYYSDTVFEDGIAPDGTPYHARRASLHYNHAAILKSGRAGAQVCLALDSMEIPTEEVTTVKLKIKGVEVDADKAQAAIDALEAELVVADKAAKDAQAARDAKDAELKEAVSDEALDKRVDERAAKQKAEKDAADRLQAVKDGYPGLELEGKSAAYIDGLYDGLQRAEAADPDGLELLTGKRGAKQPGHAATDAAEQEKRVSKRDEMIARNRAAKA